MTDVFTPQKRSEIMSKIQGKNTHPEMILRKEIWKTGMRYRVHDKSLPGCPDISNKKRRIVIFVDGCFWHACPKHFRLPKTNLNFWENKIHRNQVRREKVKEKLKLMDFNVLEYYECELKKNIDEVVKEINYYWYRQ